MSGQVFFEGSKDVRRCAGSDVGWVVVMLILLLGYAEGESGQLWCVGVLVVVEAWEKVVALRTSGLAVDARSSGPRPASKHPCTVAQLKSALCKIVYCFVTVPLDHRIIAECRL